MSQKTTIYALGVDLMGVRAVVGLPVVLMSQTAASNSPPSGPVKSTNGGKNREGGKNLRSILKSSTVTTTPDPTIASSRPPQNVPKSPNMTPLSDKKSVSLVIGTTSSTGTPTAKNVPKCPKTIAKMSQNAHLESICAPQATLSPVSTPLPKPSPPLDMWYSELWRRHRLGDPRIPIPFEVIDPIVQDHTIGEPVAIMTSEGLIPIPASLMVGGGLRLCRNPLPPAFLLDTCSCGWDQCLVNVYRQSKSYHNTNSLGVDHDEIFPQSPLPQSHLGYYKHQTHLTHTPHTQQITQTPIPQDLYCNHTSEVSHLRAHNCPANSQNALSPGLSQRLNGGRGGLTAHLDLPNPPLWLPDSTPSPSTAPLWANRDYIRHRPFPLASPQTGPRVDLLPSFNVFRQSDRPSTSLRLSSPPFGSIARIVSPIAIMSQTFGPMSQNACVAAGKGRRGGVGGVQVQIVIPNAAYDSQSKIQHPSYISRYSPSYIDMRVAGVTAMSQTPNPYMSEMSQKSMPQSPEGVLRRHNMFISQYGIILNKQQQQVEMQSQVSGEAECPKAQGYCVRDTGAATAVDQMQLGIHQRVRGLHNEEMYINHRTPLPAVIDVRDEDEVGPRRRTTTAINGRRRLESSIAEIDGGTHRVVNVDVNGLDDSVSDEETPSATELHLSPVVANSSCSESASDLEGSPSPLRRRRTNTFSRTSRPSYVCSGDGMPIEGGEMTDRYPRGRHRTTRLTCQGTQGDQDQDIFTIIENEVDGRMSRQSKGTTSTYLDKGYNLIYSWLMDPQFVIYQRRVKSQLPRYPDPTQAPCRLTTVSDYPFQYGVMPAGLAMRSGCCDHMGYHQVTLARSDTVNKPLDTYLKDFLGAQRQYHELLQQQQQQQQNRGDEKGNEMMLSPTTTNDHNNPNYDAKLLNSIPFFLTHKESLPVWRDSVDPSVINPEFPQHPLRPPTRRMSISCLNDITVGLKPHIRRGMEQRKRIFEWLVNM